MYHPYFRGKQFELLAIRETAGLLAKANFSPIIEPVKETLNGLHRTLNAICDANGSAIVIVNPFHGDHADDGDGISALLKDSFHDKGGITAGILLRDDMSPDAALACYEKHEAHKPTFVHAGFTEPRALVEKLGPKFRATQHAFFEAHCGKLYRKHFQGAPIRLMYQNETGT